MAKDFRSDRVRTNTLIGTGSSTFGKPHLGLLIYSSSQATNFGGGTVDNNMLTNVGDDVWMVVSGSTNNSITDNKLKADGSAVLFLGDVVISGTLWSERTVVEVDDTVEGNLRVPNKALLGISGSTYPKLFVDPTTPNAAAGAGRHDNGTVSFGIVNSTAPSYSTTINKDVFFHVSGSRGVKGTNDRGLALFDGDVFISGNLALSPVSVFTLPAIDALTGSDGTPWIAHSGSGDVGIYGALQVHGNSISGSAGEIITFSALDTTLAGDLRINGNDIKSSAGSTAITFVGVDTTLAGDLRINGNDIKDGDGTTVVTFDGSGNTAVGGNLKVTGNTIQASDGGNTIVMDTSDNVTIGGDLTVGGGDIKSNGGTTAITISGADTTFAGDIRINGNEIKDAGGDTVLFLSGSGNATFNKNVTIVGDLSVSGSTVSIGVENLRVEDPVILMGSGSTSINSNGGIAIASGSSVAPQALTFGRGSVNNSWRAGRKDVNDGVVATLADSEPVVIEAAGLSFPSAGASASLTITGSAVGSLTHMSMSNNDGDIKLTTSEALRFEVNTGVHIDQDKKLFLGNHTIAAHDTNGVDITGPVGGFGGLLNVGRSDGSQGFVYFPKNSKSYLYGKTAAGVADNRDITFFMGGASVKVGSDPGAPGAAGSPATSLLMMSASSNEAVGGPTILLSSSAEYGGGTSREGFIILGAAANATQADSLFSMTRHRDVRTLLSGSTNSRGTNTRGVTLISGDMMVSGSARVDGALSVGSFALANLTLTEGSDPGPYINFRDTSTRIRRNGLNLEFVDGVNSTRTLLDLASLSVTDNSTVFAVAGGEPSYIKTTGSFSFDTRNRHTTAIGDDVYFFVSGAIGSDGGSPIQRGTTLFGGDVHVSGTLRQDVTLFTTSLNTAYRTADVAGGTTVTEAGAGAIIDTGGTAQPVQIKGGSNNAYVQLGITGSMDFVGGGSNLNRIKMKSDQAFSFHNSAGEVFRMVAGSSGQNARFEGNNQLRFQDDSRYIYGLTQDTVKKIRVHNNSSGGSIVMSTTSGRMEVTGSVYPGADNTYNLGSPEYRWANLYTGDLHLRNDRGNWTIYEEPDMLVVVNNLTGKKYKMGLTPLEENE